jgi:hypothetical protein
MDCGFSCKTATKASVIDLFDKLLLDAESEQKAELVVSSITQLIINYRVEPAKKN